MDRLAWHHYPAPCYAGGCIYTAAWKLWPEGYGRCSDNVQLPHYKSA
jgi:hypothetical protein